MIIKLILLVGQIVIELRKVNFYNIVSLFNILFYFLKKPFVLLGYLHLWWT